MRTFDPGRVCDVSTGLQGTLLRIETYPGTGHKKWATVIWDWAMSARRVDPVSLEMI